MEVRVEWFQMGGWFMWPILALGALGVPLSLLALAALAPRRMVAVGVAVGLGGVALALIALGVVGQLVGMSQVEEAIAMADPTVKDILMRAGSAEVRVPLISGLAAAVLPLGGATFALARAALPRLNAPGLAGAVVLGGTASAVCAALTAIEYAWHVGDFAWTHADPAQRAVIGAAMADRVFALSLGTPLLAVVGLAVGAVLLGLGWRSAQVRIDQTLE